MSPPTADELAAFDFAYGNLACSTNHKPSLAAFAQLACDRGWAKEDFDRWALKRKWTR